MKIKNLSIILLPLILAFSCSKNDFKNTLPSFEFDKEAYGLNDAFELTIKIYPTKTEKTVRFHKDFNNIEISFLSKETGQLGLTTILNDRFIEEPNLLGDPSESIDQYIITKEKPFEKRFLGSISEVGGKIVFAIPALKINDKIDKSLLHENPTILIEGLCRTVYGIEGKAFFTKEIKVILE